MKAGVFDLDGTLLKTENGEEKAVQGVRSLLNLTRHAEGFEAVILTARTETVEEETRELMDKLDLQYDRFYMRPESEISEPDHVFKKKKLQELRREGIDVEFAVEDKDSVVEMWRSEGVTCLEMPEKHHLTHLLTDRMRSAFPYMPESFRKAYLDLYTKHFEEK